MQIGWQIKHRKFGWGEVTALDGDGSDYLCARFSDGEDRRVIKNSIVKELAAEPTKPPPPANPGRQAVAKRGKRELQDKKNEIKALLENGDERAADREYQMGRFGEFWPKAVYQKTKEDQRRHFCNQIVKLAKSDNLTEAERLFADTCSKWMKEAEFHACMLEGLEAGSHCLQAMAFALPNDREPTDELQSAFTRLLLQCDVRDLVSLGSPHAAWMKGQPPAACVTLMEWHLLSSQLAEARGGWERWFSGTQTYEIELAERLLGTAIVSDAFASAWLERLARSGLLSTAQAEKWIEFNPELGMALFEQLPAASQQSLLSAWRRDPAELDHHLSQDPSAVIALVTGMTLAVDLETDGERIWEMGCARGEQAELLFSTASGTDFAGALRALETRIGDVLLVVGHNVLAWDWPILQRDMKLDRPPLIWDTLLVQYLLEPSARSHALGAAHHADGDALATLALFSQQLQRLPLGIVRQLLLGAFRDAGQLLDGIVLALVDGLPLARSLPAAWSVVDGEVGPVVLLPDNRLRDVDWVPGVVVVQADPEDRLPPLLWQIDGERLEQELVTSGFESPAAQVLLAVMWMAQGQGIVLRRGMIPLWLAESAPVLAAAIDRAGVMPPVGSARCVSPFPASETWWAQADPTHYRVAWDGDGALIVGRSRMMAADIEKLAGERRPAQLVCIKKQAGSLWLRVDRAAGMLEQRGGWSAFSTIPVVAAQTLALPNEEKHAKSSLVLAMRRERVLYPSALDQAQYWLEILRTFREVVSTTQSALPILLIGSSSSRELVELLATGLAEIGLAEVRPAHRSRREHLLRAARRGLTLVDHVDQWPAWRELAESAGVTLVPVVEALPLEEWYAATYPHGSPKEAAAAIGNGATVASSDAAPVSVAVSGAALLEALPDLTKQRLAGWLKTSGLAGLGGAIWIIDPRAGHAAVDLRKHMECHAMDGAVWTLDERQRLDVVLAPLQVEREAAPDDCKSMERFLVQHWQPPGGLGYNEVSGFKDSQKSAMEAICARASDVLVPLPTGEGKSVLFQVPALCRGLRNRRLTLVISPLKALMKDQVERLREQGFAESADYLSSDLTPYELEEVMQGVLDHRIVLLYVAPERLRSPAFKDVLDKRVESDAGLEHVVVDEVHCVNQWGYEFRPDYFHAMEYLLRNLRSQAEDMPSPFLLLSATVTASDRERLTALLAAYPSKQLTSRLLVRPETFANPLRAHIAVSPQRVHGLINDKQGFLQAVEERLPVIIEAIGAARDNKQKTGQRSAVIVFVAWRMQAENLAALLAAQVEGGIDYYHAGLDGATRDDIYMRFRQGELDVLVATKAFGMGMDIPDIHWVIHLGPPTYLEDYLQEVGRIGRGVVERNRAALASLRAGLLFSNADFESNRSMRAQGALQLPQIEGIRQQINEHAEGLAGERIAFVPQHGYEPYNTEGQKRANTTRLKMSLYWLERAGAVELHGVTADLLAVNLELANLRQIAEEKSLLGTVARTILVLEEQTESLVTTDNFGRENSDVSGGWRERILDGLNDSLGFLFDAPATPGSASSGESSAPADHLGDDRRTAVINLSQIRVRCEIKSLDEVMACLADLEKRGGVTLSWTLAFGRRPMAAEQPLRIQTLFDSVGSAVENLINRFSKGERVQFSPHELRDEAWNIVADDKLSDEEKQKRRRRYERAWLYGFRCQARASGLRMRQIIRKDGNLVWEAMLSSTRRDAARQRNAYLLKSAKSLFELFKRDLDAGKDAISVPELIRTMQANEPSGRFRRKDLKPVLNLLAAMSLVSARPETLPLSHVVVLNNASPRLESQTALRDELKQVNDLAEVRVQAMEVFVNIPDEGRERFIEGYFAQKDAEGLKAFLDEQLGEIDDTGDEELSGFIQIKREQLRATRIVDFFKFYEKSEEPNQWKVIQHAFQDHLLVNAGPGAGKTAVLVGRIAHLIREQQIKPAEIVVLAFNRAVVFEIRKRIRELFTSLGYGSYVRGIRVSTFHSLAMRSLASPGEQVARNREDSLLADFAKKLKSDPRFCEQVASGCRCILVDEFQDVTEDVYSIIQSLHLGSGSRAGVMVIGDDDQDILRWQRKKNKEANEFAENFFTRFRSEFSGGDSAYLELGVNFRSGKRIVELSQKVITASLGRSIQSPRLKENQLRPRNLSDDRSDIERLDWKGKSWNEALDRADGICRQLRNTSPGTLAVLCHTNAEVAETYHRLVGQVPDLVVQGGENLRVAVLRHVVLWLDFLEQAMVIRDSVLTDSLKSELYGDFRKKTDIPETRSVDISSVNLESLWDLCCQEHPFPHLSTLARFIRGLKSDELDRLLGARLGESHAVVSTIHKVKGLEFDNVVVLPASTSFGARGSSQDSLERDAAEEARLLYVAMTRAKTRLVYFVGDREYAWGKSPPELHDGVHGTGLVLGGSPEDVRLGWAIERNNYNNRDPYDCQNYIEKEVRIGDPIVLGGTGQGKRREIMHRSSTGGMRQVGFIANKHGAGSNGAALQVSAVVRYYMDDMDGVKVPPAIVQRGWGYVVLVSGRLR